MSYNMGNPPEKTMGKPWEIPRKNHGNMEVDPLVNVYLPMENHHLLLGQVAVSMVIFNSYVSYVKLPEGKNI